MKDPNEMNPWHDWSAEVGRRLLQQQQQIDRLEAQLAQIQGKLKALEAKPTYNIESIEYRFDQLKVEKLEGTLNIGMTLPGGDGTEQLPGTGNVEQFTVGDEPNYYPSAQSTMTQPEGPYRELANRVDGYVSSEGQQRLLSHELELELPLDPHHRRIVLEDVRKQLPARIHHYIQQLTKEEQEQLRSSPGQMTERIFEKTKRDAEAAIGAYMRQLKANVVQPEG
ncbi:spore germination protein GerPC [Paenibacillus sp. LHD-117]|uniref:spore germination protein GerPC n=1 Tax=Paenibacillus sp. LHD-117 TaxID=3071412 RepID=UPI0027DF04E5|nr:spore germination protein GerPC [Paenibacillus sp. LHD-117]MDQ6421083.1 spore germination protein GerPC [Paenibacillus sp. LHD-117]